MEFNEHWRHGKHNGTRRDQSTSGGGDYDREECTLEDSARDRGRDFRGPRPHRRTRSWRRPSPSSRGALAQQPPRRGGPRRGRRHRLAPLVDGTQSPTPVTVVSTDSCSSRRRARSPRRCFSCRCSRAPSQRREPEHGHHRTQWRSPPQPARPRHRAHARPAGWTALRARHQHRQRRRRAAARSAGPARRVVTGGASAAYGSEPCGRRQLRAGHQVRGLKGSSRRARCQAESDNQGGKTVIAAGKSFMNDRLSCDRSLEYYTSDGVPTANARDWASAAPGTSTTRP